MVRKGETKEKKVKWEVCLQSDEKKEFGTKEEVVESCTQPLFVCLCDQSAFPGSTWVPGSTGTAQHLSLRFTSWPGENPLLEDKVLQLPHELNQRGSLSSSYWQSVPYWDGSRENWIWNTF